MPDSLADAVAWLLEDRARGYKRAAKRFGLDVDVVTEAGRAARAGRPAHAPARPREEPTESVAIEPEVEVAADIVSMTKLERLEWQLREAERHLHDLEHNPKGTTALAGMHRQIAELGKQLDEERDRIERSTPDPRKTMSDGELWDVIRAILPTAPPDEFDLVAEIVDDRRGGLKIVGGTDA